MAYNLNLVAAVFVSSALLVGPTTAQTQPIGKRLSVSEQIEKITEECEKKDQHVVGCASGKEQELGHELAKVYQIALRLAAKDAPLLREAQRNWVKYQENNCNFHERNSLKDGQTIAHGAKVWCLLRTTIHRLEEIKVFIEER